MAAANDTYYASTPDDSVEDDDDDADDLPDVSSPGGAERWEWAMAEAESDYLDTVGGWPCSTATTNRRVPLLACQAVPNANRHPTPCRFAPALTGARRAWCLG